MTYVQNVRNETCLCSWGFVHATVMYPLKGAHLFQVH